MEQPNESVIKGVLTSEVKYFVAIVVFLFGIATPYFGMRQDIALIQQSISNINTNHEAHIQDILSNIEEIRKQQVAQQEEIIALQKQFLTILNK